VRRHAERHRGIHARQLFDAHAIVDGAHSCATVGLGNLNPQQAQRRQLRDEFVGKCLGLVPGHHVWTDLGFGEVADRPSQHDLVIGEPEVHGDPSALV